MNVLDAKESDGTNIESLNAFELKHNVVDFITPAPYIVRAPQPPAFFFLIDVTYSSILEKVVHIAADVLKQLIERLPGDDRTRVGIATFDSKMHFYDLTKSRPHVQICGDVTNSFVPPGYQYFFNRNEYMDNIKTLLDTIPAMYSDTQDTRSCLGTALKNCHAIMKPFGGKLILITSLRPEVVSVKNDPLGEGRLANRLQTHATTNKEPKLIVPEDGFYSRFALELSNSHISVDTFFFDCGTYLDVATLSQLSTLTGGQSFYYKGFYPGRDGLRFCRDLEKTLLRETGYEGVMRIRTSSGLKAEHYYGNVFLRSVNLVALPSIDSDKSFTIQFKVDNNVKNTIYIQAALLYTASSGLRIIRVINHAIPISANWPEVYEGIDCPALVNTIAKASCNKLVTSTSHQQTRDYIIKSCVDILSGYKQNVSGFTQGTSQISMPNSLQMFPLYMLGLLKSRLMATSALTSPDDLSSILLDFKIMDSTESALFLYPSLYKLYPLDENAGYADEYGTICLPPMLSLSSSNLDRNGIFAIDNGKKIFVWIGKDVPVEALQQLIGITQASSLEEETVCKMQFWGI